MTVYSIEIKQSAKKELSQIPKAIAEKIVTKIKELSFNPRPNGYRKLAGTEHNYRIRVGDYRVVYAILDQQLIIQIIKLGHRKSIYK